MAKIKRFVLAYKWWLVAIAVPVLYLLYLLLKYGVNVPFWDEWEIVTLLQKHDAGTLSLYDFWAQHNEHRLLFPQLIMVYLGFLTHWNLNAELLVSFAFAAASLLLVLHMLYRNFGATRRPVMIALGIFAAVLFFSPMQWENWLWGWQIEWYMVIFGAIATVWAITSWPKSWPERLALPVAIATAFFATYSLGNGPFTWIVGAVLLFLMGSSRRKLLVWGGAAAVTLASHYYHYSGSAGQPPKSLLLHEPLQYIEYVFIYMGRPLAFDIHTSFIFGGIIALACGWALWRIIQKRNVPIIALPWVGLVMFGAMSALSTGISRLGYGRQQAFSNRYMTVSMLLTLGIVVLVITLWPTAKKTKKATQARVQQYVLASVAVLTLILAINYPKGVHSFANQSQYLKDIQRCTKAPNPYDICLLSAYPNKDRVRGMINYLKEKHLSSY
ncbi:MAG TPA: hypothetical protein VLE73_04830 [Candidatus Saccharimonadales bacterium]|nr:hypothetical protein [Candidatus Saccharimonadales bacterium]